VSDPGAGDESPAERPVLTVGQVYRLADLIDVRYRALILVTTFGSLRFGEAAGLQRADVSLDLGTVRIRQALVEVVGQGLVLGPPKSRAGLRTVALPPPVVGELREHIERYVADELASFVFTGPKGAPLRRGNFNGLVNWAELVDALGAPGLHFHDLRHTGNTLAARSGVSTRDLMARMGHDSMRAALIYQHVTTQADRTIADALDAQVRTVSEGH
jgi:integrase